MSPAWKNKLFFGDNLDILRNQIDTASVDLIYLDPPFNSQATYNILFAEKSGELAAAQITAFEDTWHWNLEAEKAYREVVTFGSKKVADLVQAFRTHLAISLIKHRLTDVFGAELSAYEEFGLPQDYASAEALAPIATFKKASRRRKDPMVQEQQNDINWQAGHLTKE
ncbi:hypothetical protein [Desulfobacca acetoxidans]|uniref:Site-specific DNA-methyltransferase n=1 Tax=Desulfobacca acetoxidans (strain ATCC 700848 / DSM 11109 / ASRB2) TaxID=880072 RepID=F2NCJ9_DESAR|nr:hypothetical protein [Desulfobacca acetoxidans]AEB09133.1 hypothetical protein Desac_1276 [Desulfobacca acetoxidans DSM 11109]